MIEGDYQFSAANAVHFGYRYGRRKIVEAFEGYNLGSNGTFQIRPLKILPNVRKRKTLHVHILEDSKHVPTTTGRSTLMLNTGLLIMCLPV